MIPTDTLLQSFAEMLSELEEYLLSPELFWPLSSRSRVVPKDRLTLGNLLLCHDQLHAMRQSWDIQTETSYTKFELQWEQSKEKWKSSIIHKATQELGSRLNLWRAYLMDLEDGQGAGFDYRHEVRNRVIIERLFDLDVGREAWEKDLQAIDRLHRSLVDPCDFIWPKFLQPEYPQRSYWFLYRTPRKKD